MRDGIQGVLNLAKDILLSFYPLFCHQGRIGGHPIEYAQVVRFLYLADVGSIDEKLHMGMQLI